MIIRKNQLDSKRTAAEILRKKASPGVTSTVNPRIRQRYAANPAKKAKPALMTAIENSGFMMNAAVI